MNERLKELRKALSLTQQEFANRLNTSRNNIAGYEINSREPSSAVLSLICREFNVNESWLRNGEGEMFVSLDTMSLDDFIKTNQADPLEIQILKAYFSLDKDVRKSVLNHFKDTLKTPCP